MRISDWSSDVCSSELEAYGWPANLSDEEVLTRLVALNKERAAEEAKGLIRWLRPEFQAPDYKAPVTQTLDLRQTAAVLPVNEIGRAHVLTPVTNAHIVYRLLLEHTSQYIT